MPEDPEAKRKRQLEQAAHARAAQAENRNERHRTHMSIRVELRRTALDSLSEEAERQGITRADLIREILYEHVGKIPKRERGHGW